METNIRKFVVYGAPWFTSTLGDAATVTVSEPDIAVNGHVPIELRERRVLNIEESFKRYWREKAT